MGTNAAGTEAAIVVQSGGGRSWTAAQVPFGVTGLFGVSCVSARHCWAVGTIAGGAQGVILDTNDGGVSWIVDFMPPQIGALVRISCWGATCLATGGSLGGQVLATGDDGVTIALRSLRSSRYAT